MSKFAYAALAAAIAVSEVPDGWPKGWPWPGAPWPPGWNDGTVLFTPVDPTNGETGIADGTWLEWGFPLPGYTFDVFLKAASEPLPADAAPVIATTPPTSYLGSTGAGVQTINPGTLLARTTYYWQVVARGALGVFVGPVWSFTTVAAPLIITADSFGRITYNGLEYPPVLHYNVATTHIIASKSNAGVNYTLCRGFVFFTIPAGIGTPARAFMCIKWTYTCYTSPSLVDVYRAAADRRPLDLGDWNSLDNLEGQVDGSTTGTWLELPISVVPLTPGALLTYELACAAEAVVPPPNYYRLTTILPYIRAEY